MWHILLFIVLPVQADDLYTASNLTSTPCTDRNHLFLVPGVLSAGGTNRACISRFFPEGPARMVITLHADEETVVATRELPPGDGGCLDIAVPQRPNTRAEVNVNIWYPEAKCSWASRTAVRIGSGKVLVLHTERARYRAGDTVRARILTLKADLTPAHGYIDEVWLEGPQGAWMGVRAAQWLRLRTKLGLSQIQHQLDELAPPGRWTVNARLGDGSQSSAAFWVGNYEIPPFQLTVKHAPRILRTSDRLVWTVCVRYPWTEAVEGMLVIRLRGAGGRDPDSSGIRTAVRLRAPRACHRHAAAARRIGLDGDNPPDVVVADFSFQEEGTRIWQNTTVVSQVIDNPYTLEFLTKHRAVLSPGLPYKLKVKATRWDDKPASNERVRICRGPGLTPNVSCVEALTDSGGRARVLFTADEDHSPFYTFHAQLHNATASIRLSRRGTHAAALGPLRDSRARTLLPLYLNLKDVDAPITVHFVVITRGGIIYRWGATTQCPTTSSTTQLQVAPRNSTCYTGSYSLPLGKLEASKDNISDWLMDRHLLRVMLPIKVTHQMCPDSHLVAYFYYKGELISANKHFEMEECFANKVEASWTTRQVSPGATATLSLSTVGPALCALTVVDSAAHWLQPPVTVKETLLQALKTLVEGHRNLTEHDADGECFLTADSMELPSSSKELTSTYLASAGVRLVGGDVPSGRTCGTPPASLTAGAVIPRSDVSEAWLWRLVAVDAGGSVLTSGEAPHSVSRFEAGALCLARSGLAAAPPAVLQVFQEFFIHADSPRRLRRGDSAIVKYRIFNYLYEPLNVQMLIIPDSHLEASSLETACIAARSSIARRSEVRAKLPGSAKLSIRATTVSNGDCGNGTVTRGGVSDEVVIRIEVEPEGVPVEDHKSIMLCAKDSTEGSLSEVTWDWPPVQAVPGTEELVVWATGDSTGPLLADADSLVLLPRGCGEQNMARLATSLLALRLLPPRAAAAAAARDHVARGFTRQLQYVHPSGGFSAFGPSDPTPSTWLTAFCVRYLRKAYQVISPGAPSPPALERAEHWLVAQHMENGCFRNEGQLFHRELKGGLNEDGEVASVALTAYVVTSLVESGLPLPSPLLQNCLSCLRALPPSKASSPSRVYARALLAYAFVRLRKYEVDLRKTNEASLLWDKRKIVGAGLEEDEEIRQLMELLKIAKRSGDYVWWETGNLATSIEATSYALLALGTSGVLRRGFTEDARGAHAWLQVHRNVAGGFVSTQDTLVALEALTRWSSIQPTSPANLTVAISGGSSHTLNLYPGNRIPEMIKMDASRQLRVSVQGSGCGVIQASRMYRSLSPDEKRSQLSVQVSVHTQGPFNCDNNTMCFCAAVVQACVVWSGQFPDMALLEVALPGGFAADAALLYKQLHNYDPLLRRIELSPTASRATLYLGLHPGEGGYGGHRCYSLHAVGPAAKTKSAYAKLLDYYRPSVQHTQMYTIPEDCPSNTASTSDYLPTQNLYAKAKSLDSDDILMMDEYSYEDIPDGIPLEDPIYDNLPLTRGDYNDPSNLKEEQFNDKKYDINENIPVTINYKNKNNIINIKVKDFPDSGINYIDNPRQSKVNNEINEVTYDKEISNIKNETTNITTTVIERQSIAETHNEPTTEVYSNKTVKENNSYNEDQILESNNHYNKEPATHNNTQFKKDVTERPSEKYAIENPNLSNFHIIDSEKDLEVPSGVEGPIPTIVLPPVGFLVTLPQPGNPDISSQDDYRGYFSPSYGHYEDDYYPYSYRNYRNNRRINVPND